MVTTSDNGKKSKMGVSADWCVAVEYWKLSSIRNIFVDYQTSKFLYTGKIIEDAWGLSSIAPITQSRGSSSETLTGVELCHRRLSQIGVFLL